MNLNKKFSLSVALSLLAIQISPIVAIANDIERYKTILNKETNTDYEYDETIYSEAINEKLKETLRLLDLYKAERNIEDIKKAILEFSSITSVMEYGDIKCFEEGDVFDYIFYSIRDEIYLIKDENLKASLLIYYGEKIFLGWRKLKLVDTYGEKYLIKGLVEFNNGKIHGAQSRLDYLKALYIYFLDEPDYDYDSDEIPDIDIDKPIAPPVIKPPEVEDDTNSDVVVGGGTSSGSSNGGNNSYPQISEGRDTEYLRKGDKCIKIETKYKDGKVVSKREYTVPKQEYARCGIYTYVHGDMSKNNYKPVLDRDYIDNDQNLLSKNSIHYTVDKKSKYPYYFDTGIKTSVKDDSLTYNQLKDALYQLSIKAEGFNIVDNNKTLVVMEGKPIVLDSKKKNYSKQEVESLLDKYDKTGFKIMESSSDKHYTLESSILGGSINSVLVNGEKKTLSEPAILIENQLSLPINEVAVYLGASVDLNKNTLKIVKGNTIITVDKDSKNYFINGIKKVFKSTPIIEEGSFFAEFAEISKTLGYEMYWDSDTNEITFTEK